MYRNELKYFISSASAHILSHKLRNICSTDGNADSDGRYRVTSLYFDDYADSAVSANLGGDARRKKFRIRVYNGSDTLIRLERKSKNGTGCKKDTAILTKGQYEMLLSGQYDFLQASRDPVMLDLYTSIQTRLLRPKVIVDYMREAYVYGPGNVRITLDRHVRSSIGNVDLFRSDGMFAPAMDTRDIILEVKYTGFLPRHIAEMVQQSHSLRQSASKYTMCRLIAAKYA